MSLSPIAQYCIRKLLKQNFENLDSLFLAASNQSGLSDDQIDRLFHQFSSSRTQLQELELLTNLYQQLERNPANSSAIAEIKRRIFQTLGFQNNNVPSAQLPSIVQEGTIEVFRFFHKNQIREGIRFDNTLFAAVYQFELTYRLQAYQMAWTLSEAKIPLVISLSPTRFVIWVNLQCPSSSVLLCQDAQLLETLFKLNLALRKAKSTGKRVAKHLRPDFFGKKIVTVFPKATNTSDH
ncbi:hypothetical protein IQ250_07435 [Pseudanabaenaceae cyanobacterium LEGE 13415]|nr:hypothetical protein [Pseudanabaenaceae cyanobacterium LEGE 13415]